MSEDYSVGVSCCSFVGCGSGLCGGCVFKNLWEEFGLTKGGNGRLECHFWTVFDLFRTVLDP